MFSTATEPAAQTRSNPNVIIIYADDHGYTDLGLFGIDGNVDTPHMDTLARDGALMTNGYCSAPQCRPSRCGLMAGRIQNEFGFSQNHSDPGEGVGTLPRTYPEGTDMAGPHLPRIELDDPYYRNFPKQDYPHYNEAQDDVRHQGLALLKAMDDSIGGVVKKLRDLGLEENTLILFAGDNGAPTKIRTGGGTPDVNGWNGSNNVSMRANKGNLLEGGIRVPMVAYWKGTIPAGQVIDEMVTTLDFTATTLAAGGGKIPPEFDGVNILPRLTGQASSIARTQPMFWDFFFAQAVRPSMFRIGSPSEADRLP
ncbi:MAG TPA: sulfatase-like hydrolase/transferase [Sedimentisphaerales bacterium]|nr:sulfatase-like hydrolase/transferase [Sedimentisphaerales bacterium]